MSHAVPLLDLQQMHLGFMLVAGAPPDYPSTIGHWEAECILMGPPAEAQLIDEPAYAVIAEHHLAGEHRLAIVNDGTTVSFEAHSPDGAVLYLVIPHDALGEWGTQSGATRTRHGYAHFLDPEAD